MFTKGHKDSRSALEGEATTRAPTRGAPTGNLKMQSDAKTPEEYLSELEPKRREAISAVREVILDNLPDGYEEVMQHVYADESVSEWFRERYLATGKKLNMGKSCVRFRKLENIPLDLVAEVAALTPFDRFVEEARASKSG